MSNDLQDLKKTFDQSLARLWNEVGWKTPREKADPIVWDAIQACHAFHRAATPAYRERCEREGIGASIEFDQLSLLVFPEEIWKGYSQVTLPNGEKMGVFCERDVPRLIEYLNQYLSTPLTMTGLQSNYMAQTNLKGGLDQLRADLLKSQGVQLLTSSGTTGSAISLIPVDQRAYEDRVRINRMTFDVFTDLPGYGPIVPERDTLVSYSPEDGSMLMSVAMKDYAQGFGDRKFITIPARIFTRELRWRAGVFTGLSGKILKPIMGVAMAQFGKRTGKKGMENTIAALKKAEALGKRTLIFVNVWMGYKMLKHMEALLEEEIRAGRKKPGEPYIQLAPGSVMLNAGGNKSGLDIKEEDIFALIHKVIGGIDRLANGYGKAESMVSIIRCDQGHYHLDPHMIFFKTDRYLAFFDPREIHKVPVQITGDFVDDLVYTSCSCGLSTGYFRIISRDNANRGSKGCAAALQEYAYR
jgi:hypothetical protein